MRKVCTCTQQRHVSAYATVQPYGNRQTPERKRKRDCGILRIQNKLEKTSCKWRSPRSPRFCKHVFNFLYEFISQHTVKTCNSFMIYIQIICSFFSALSNASHLSAICQNVHNKTHLKVTRESYEYIYINF